MHYCLREHIHLLLSDTHTLKHTHTHTHTLKHIHRHTQHTCNQPTSTPENDHKQYHLREPTHTHTYTYTCAHTHTTRWDDVVSQGWRKTHKTVRCIYTHTHT